MWNLKRSMPGFASQLLPQIEALSPELLEQLNRPGGIEVAEFIDLVLTPRDHTVYMPDPVDSSSIQILKEDLEALSVGKEALSTGRVAQLIVSPCQQEFIWNGANSLNDLWIIVDSSSSHLEWKNEIIRSNRSVQFFDHHHALVLTPENILHFDHGAPVTAPCGTGDAISLLNSEILIRFIDRGGKWIYLSEDLTPVDPILVGRHILNNRPVTCVLEQRVVNDSRGLLCEHAGFQQVVDPSRVSHPIDPVDFSFSATGTYVIDACLNFESVMRKWVRKKIALRRMLVVKHESYVHDLTAAFQTQFIRRL